jgi:hypothetical protein
MTIPDEVRRHRKGSPDTKKRERKYNIDTQKTTLTIHVGKTGSFSGLGHEHEVRAPIHSGTADTGSHPAVEIHVDARALRVIDKNDSEKERGEVQKTMLGAGSAR